jgi:hypothetical protein
MVNIKKQEKVCAPSTKYFKILLNNKISNKRMWCWVVISWCTFSFTTIDYNGENGYDTANNEIGHISG